MLHSHSDLKMKKLRDVPLIVGEGILTESNRRIYTMKKQEHGRRRQIMHSDSVSERFSCMTRVAEAACKHEKGIALNASDTCGQQCCSVQVCVCPLLCLCEGANHLKQVWEPSNKSLNHNKNAGLVYGPLRKIPAGNTERQRRRIKDTGKESEQNWEQRDG